MDKIKINLALVGNAKIGETGFIPDVFFIKHERWGKILEAIQKIANDTINGRGCKNRLELMQSIIEIAETPQEVAAITWTAYKVVVDVNEIVSNRNNPKTNVQVIEVPPGADAGQFINEFLKGVGAVPRDPKEIN